MIRTSPDYRRLVDKALGMLGGSRNDPRLLPEPWSTAILVDTPMALIDNGGVEYLFESELPCQPAYTDISDAFHRIGASAYAQAILEAVAMLGLAEPHMKSLQRVKQLEALLRLDPTAFSALNERMWACNDIDQLAVGYAKSLGVTI